MSTDPTSMKRPSIDEYDCMSWLDGSLTEHDVLAETPEGYQLGGAPSFRTEGINHGEASFPTRCEQHSYEHAAATFGYEGPVTIRTAYQSGHPMEEAQGMLLRDGAGKVVSIATYSFGRASFEPGEPRTDPCSICGTETLTSERGFDG